MQVTVTLTAVQTMDGESNRTEQTMAGTLEKTNDGVVLQYREPPQEEEDGAAVTVTVRADRVVIDRRGSTVSQMLLEAGKRHLCRYDTPYGRLMLHTRTSFLSWDGVGVLRAVYALEMQDMQTDHEIEIRIKEVSSC
ncbi:MAG: DUF1934 domain-containing protein [Clostridia bacterium]|nr:DUF1934 domain-containing protein [Clostridia bacterium]